jgi:hypothetical protein
MSMKKKKKKKKTKNKKKKKKKKKQKTIKYDRLCFHFTDSIYSNKKCFYKRYVAFSVVKIVRYF